MSQDDLQDKKEDKTHFCYIFFGPFSMFFVKYFYHTGHEAPERFGPALHGGHDWLKKSLEGSDPGLVGQKWFSHFYTEVWTGGGNRSGSPPHKQDEDVCAFSAPPTSSLSVSLFFIIWWTLGNPGCSSLLICWTVTGPCGNTNMPDYAIDYSAIFRHESSRLLLASAGLNPQCAAVQRDMTSDGGSI